MRDNIGSRLFGHKITNFSKLPDTFRKQSPANLSGEWITDDFSTKNVHPPIGTGRPVGQRKRRPQDSWPGYLERHKKLFNKVKKGLDKENRLRGGGTGEYGASLFPGDGDFTWYNSKFLTVPQRMEGGGCGEAYPSNDCAKPPMKPRNLPPLNNDFLSLKPHYFAGNRCKLKCEDDADKNCSCAPQNAIEATLKGKSPGFCSKKRCDGSDCLIQAFKEAQEFVDGLGKVPGLAGLGIVQGPYFSGVKPQQKEIKKGDSKANLATKPSLPALCDPLSPENMKKPPNNVARPSARAESRSFAVQEGNVTFPEGSNFPKGKKKDEKPKDGDTPASTQPNEDQGPCGDPKCKSRLKKKEAKKTENLETNNSEEVTNEKKPAPKNNTKSNDKHSKSRPSHRASKSSPGLKTKHATTKYAYDFGNSPPTHVYGHKYCNAKRLRVPAKQGWAWDKADTIKVKWYKPRLGWRPGAISSVIREILNEAKEGFFKQHASRPRSAPSKIKKGQAMGPKKPHRENKPGCPQEEEIEDIEYPPTLHVHRKDGTYYITMYPIKPETEDLQRLDEPINPLQFKIVKSKTSIASSSTASDLEIEFSPPAAVNRLRRKPNVVHTGTQVKQQQITDEFKKSAGPKNKESKKDAKKK